MSLQQYTDEEIIAEYNRRKKAISLANRKRRDHERYVRNRDERIRKQAEYYHTNREAILKRKHDTGSAVFGSLR